MMKLISYICISMIRGYQLMISKYIHHRPVGFPQHVAIMQCDHLETYGVMYGFLLTGHQF